MGIGDGISFGGFVADVVAMSVPAATGVGEVEDFVEVEVEVGFGEDAVVGIIRLRFRFRLRMSEVILKLSLNLGLSPEVTVVVAGEWGAFHGDGGDGGEFSKIGEVFLETKECLFMIAFAESEVVVMIAYLVAEVGDLFYDFFVIRLGEDPKIVAAFDA